MALHPAQTSEQFMMSWTERWANIVSRICSGRLAERGCPGSVAILRSWSSLTPSSQWWLFVSSSGSLIWRSWCSLLESERQYTTAAHSLTRLLVTAAAGWSRDSATRFMLRGPPSRKYINLIIILGRVLAMAPAPNSIYYHSCSEWMGFIILDRMHYNNRATLLLSDERATVAEWSYQWTWQK